MKARIPNQNMGSRNDMMQKIQKMQDDMAKAQEEVENTEFTASQCGGAVEVRINGKHEVLGITINIRQVTYGEIYSQVFPNHDYEMGYGGWGPDYDDPYTYLELFYGPNPNNYSNYKNAEVDALLEQAKKDPDQVARMNALGKAEEIILSEGALLPLQMRTAHYLIDEDLTDIHFYYGSVNLIWCYGDVK